MTQKTKLILFLLFLFLLGIISLILFRNPAFAPHVISIQNKPPMLPSEELIEATKDTPEVIPENNITPPPVTPEPPGEKLPDQVINKPATKTELQVTKKLVSWGYTSATSRKIDTIIIHSSYNALGGSVYDLDKLMAEYQAYGVAPHYLIDRKGKIYQLVEDKNIAYHAGESKVPDGRTQVNNFSLGIELMNTEEDKYTSEQYQALKNLLSQVKSNHSIKYVMGHDDIAPGRKTDPWNFDWKKIN